MQLRDLVELYVGSRDLSPGYQDQLRYQARALDRAGIQTTGELTAENLNAAINQWKSEGRTAETLRSRRRMSITLGEFASDEGLGPLFVRRKVMSLRRPARIPTAWTLEEVRRLLGEAEALVGSYSHGIARAAYWSSYIRAAWDTGLRGCDLRAIEREAIPPSGRVLRVQQKTGARVWLQFRETTLEAIAAAYPPHRSLIWPFWARREQWSVEARKLVRAAGLSGAIGRLRHSCGTAVEVEHPGRGHERLGNTRQVFERHYYDERQRGAFEILLPAEL